MLDPQYFNIERSVVEILGGALLVWFVVMFALFYLHERQQTKTRGQIRR